MMISRATNTLTTCNPMEAFCLSPSLSRPALLLRPRSSDVLSLAVSVSGYPRGLRHGSLLSGSISRNRSIFSFAASDHKDSSSEIDIQEGVSDRLTEESEKAWKQTLASFKEQAKKMLNISQEAYEEFLKKATIELKETSEQLKIQADKVSGDLSETAKELSEEGKVYLSAAVPVKDFVETFSSSSSTNKDLKVLDFYVGIPFGGLLTLWGLLPFIATGSISAIRLISFTLGGTLLGLGIYSLRSWKKGESSSIALKGQTAIATLLFMKDARLVFLRPVFPRYFALIISGAALAFYVYRIAYSVDSRKVD